MNSAPAVKRRDLRNPNTQAVPVLAFDRHAVQRPHRLTKEFPEVKRASALCAAALAVTLALAGCGLRARAAAHRDGNPAQTSVSNTSPGPTGAATSGAAGGTATSTTDELNSVDQTLTSVGKSMTGVNTQITAGDQAGDDDN